MNKETKHNEVEEKSDVTCGHVRKCCGYSYECEATHTVLPTGTVIFEHCGCYR
ncbi:hypothetical protein [Bacillus bombysepticus]|uniref:hypothetical protein n=1 Tax=Bacillus bombysepticus TaxID=658666 RepID=UPI003015B454